jgi:quercetin dioxygenase-like cupin family protein
MLLSSKESLLESFGEPPWTTSLLDDERNKANLIGHSQGMTNNAHWHPDFNEWWTILQGDLTFQVGEDRPLIEATQGDIVFVPEGMKHFISSVGKGISLRLAVTNSENQHIYTADDDSAPPPIS